MKTVRIFLLVLIIIGLILIFTEKIWVPKLVNRILLSEGLSTTPAETSSLEGCYVANLAKDVYTFDIQSDNNGVVSGILAFNNSQKDSSSGTFQGTLTNDTLLGNYSFDSEGTRSNRQVIFKKAGDNLVEAFGPVKTVRGNEVFVTPLNVSYDPKSTFIKSATCTEHFVGVNNTFAFDYNAFFQASEGVNSGLEWRQNTTDKGVLLTSVSVPKSFMTGTNFSDARFTVGKSDDTTAIKNCVAVTNGEVRGASKIISSHSFDKTTLNDAGAGNFYETTSYRGIVGGNCYAVEYTIHSTNIANYPPELGIKEFDKSKIKKELEKIVTSFKFL
jgi:hypothetical protein